MRPFTYEAYRQMLFEMQAAGYKFLGYGEAADPPFCWLRHDVDVDLGYALKIAAIEADLGIRSTFCIMVRSMAYNILSPEIERLVQRIVDLGHRVGLHFDCSCYSPTFGVDELRRVILWEEGLLRNAARVEASLVSFHKPGPLVLLGDPALTHPYPHAYARKFMGGSNYFADSGGWFRFGHPLDSPAFREKKIITLNIHPVWWSRDGRSPLYALKEVVATQRGIVCQYLLDNVVGV